MISFEAQDRAVIVVGAGGGGIGTAIAAAAAAAGAEVIAVDRDASSLAAAVRDIEADGSRIRGELCDAEDGEAVDSLFERLALESADLFGLVNVVGGLPPGRWSRLVDDDDENLGALLESNLRIAVRTSRAFARTRISRGQPGSIVQIASIAGLEAMPFGAGYAASKAALLSYMRTMALEWGEHGIRVNAIAPGTIQVHGKEAGEDAEEARRVIPLGRRGKPEDIASATLFLLSDLAAWITGQVLAVDGGASIKPAYLDAEGLPVFVRDEDLRRRLLHQPASRPDAKETLDDR